MGVRFEVQNAEQVQLQMLAQEKAVEKAVEQVQQNYRDEVKETLEETSPVRTGKYKGNWRTDQEGETYYVWNPTEYAKYLVWPNQRMVGSDKADKPGAGIIHNVRGRIKTMQKKYEKSMISRVSAIVDASTGFD